jgi:hypothetical protein
MAFVRLEDARSVSKDVDGSGDAGCDGACVFTYKQFLDFHGMNEVVVTDCRLP